jgi:hypothetical protein
MKKLVFIVVLYSLSVSALADEFYVAYEWKDKDQSLIRSWNTGSVDANINTAAGIAKLIALIKKGKGIDGTIVILFLKKLEGIERLSERKNFINT